MRCVVAGTGDLRKRPWRELRKQAISSVVLAVHPAWLQEPLHSLWIQVVFFLFGHVPNMFKSCPHTSAIISCHCLLFTTIVTLLKVVSLHLPRNIHASRLRGMCAGPWQSQGSAATHGEGEDLGLAAQRTNGQYLFAWLFNLGLREWCWSLVGTDDHKVGRTRRVVHHPWWKTRCFNLRVSCIAALPSPAVGFYLQRNPFLFFYQSLAVQGQRH